MLKPKTNNMLKNNKIEDCDQNFLKLPINYYQAIIDLYQMPKENLKVECQNIEPKYQVICHKILNQITKESKKINLI